MLERFKLAKADEIFKLEKQVAESQLPPIYEGARPSFAQAVSRKDSLAIIAEYKRMSPSEGVIMQNIPPLQAAGQYAAAGADALSVLTEESHFDGSMEYLRIMSGVGRPLLRKDFIFHPLQVRATASTPASAFLLIVKLTPDSKLLRRLRELGEKFGLDSVVEITDQYDLDIARNSGAKIIQVNSRDLNSMQVDLPSAMKLGEFRRDGEIWILASGISQPEHLELAYESGYNAVLVGTSLMRGGRPGMSLRKLLAAVRPASRLMVKICGMTRQEDVTAASQNNVDMVGFIFSQGSPRNITPEAAAAIHTPLTVRRVGVFTGASTSSIRDVAKRARLDYVQLHGDFHPLQVSQICETIPVIKVVWPERINANGTHSDLTHAMGRDFPGLHLLDSGHGGGGSGVELTWKNLHVPLDIPWILAGGLNPENVGAAISLCHPTGIDLNSGVEDAPGIKNHIKIKAALEAARKVQEDTI